MSERDVVCDALNYGERYAPEDWIPLATDVLAALKKAGYAVVELPTVACKGPDATDAGFFRQAADRIDTGTNVYIGGSNVRAAVSQLLRRAADAAEEK